MSFDSNVSHGRSFFAENLPRKLSKLEGKLKFTHKHFQDNANYFQNNQFSAEIEFCALEFGIYAETCLLCGVDEVLDNEDCWKGRGVWEYWGRRKKQ
jgi:hypothetical protein